MPPCSHVRGSPWWTSQSTIRTRLQDGTAACEPTEGRESLKHKTLPKTLPQKRRTKHNLVHAGAESGGFASRVVMCATAGLGGVYLCRPRRDSAIVEQAKPHRPALFGVRRACRQPGRAATKEGFTHLRLLKGILSRRMRGHSGVQFKRWGQRAVRQVSFDGIQSPLSEG